MKLMKKICKGFKNLDRMQKAEVVIASMLTVLLFVGFPALAWFAHSTNLKTITKVKDPGEIVIRAGKSDQNEADADPAVNFELKDINIENIAKGETERHVFSVKPGDYNPQYDLILAHTTNIPFVYTIYKAEYVDSAALSEMSEADKKDKIAVYTPIGETVEVNYKKVGTALSMSVLNDDSASATTYGRTLALRSGTHYDYTYITGDDPEVYAVPIYSKTTYPISHPENSADTYDYFILEITWDSSANTTDGFKYSNWNEADNNKETDMIYITAHKHTS